MLKFRSIMASALLIARRVCVVKCFNCISSSFEPMISIIYLTNQINSCTYPTWPYSYVHILYSTKVWWRKPLMNEAWTKHDKQNFDKMTVGFIQETLKRKGKFDKLLAIHQIHQSFAPSNFWAIYSTYVVTSSAFNTRWVCWGIGNF